MLRWPTLTAGQGGASRDDQDEGLSVRQAVEWCEDEITTREATRLRRLAQAHKVGESKVKIKN